MNSDDIGQFYKRPEQILTKTKNTNFNIWRKNRLSKSRESKFRKAMSQIYVVAEADLLSNNSPGRLGSNSTS